MVHGLTVHRRINVCIDFASTVPSAGRWQRKVVPSTDAACQAKSLLYIHVGKRISGEALDVLKDLSQRGMNSSSKACQPLIAEASSRTGLSEQQLKVSQMMSRNSLQLTLSPLPNLRTRDYV